MPAFENQRQQDEEQEFKVILGYVVNWRLTWATWELVNQKKAQPWSTKEEEEEAKTVL